MSDNKKIAKNSIILYFRLIVTSTLGLIVTRIVVRNLGVSDYGLYSVVGSIVIMMQFLNTVMVSTTYRYIAYELGREEGKYVNKVFNISLSIHIAIIFIVIILAETIGVWYINNHLNVDPNKISDAFFVFHFSVLATVINIFSIPFQGLITAMEKFSVRASIEILRSVIKLGFVIMLAFYIGNKLRFYAVLMAILTFIASSLFVLYCKKKYTHLSKWHPHWDWEKNKEMFAFSGWTMIGAAAHMGKNMGSPLIINYFFGTILNAAFGIANQLNRFLMMFSKSLGQAAIPQIIKSYSGGNQKRTLNLVAYIGKYSFFLLFFPALPVLLETKFLIKLWIGEIPDYTVIFCKLMIINALIESLTSGIPAAVQATGKIKWFQIINSSILLMGLPITYLLFRMGFLPYTIQIVYICSTVTYSCINIILLKIIINFNVLYLMKTSYLRAFLVVLFILPLFFLHSLFQESILRFFLSATLSVCYYLTIIYFVGFEKKEKGLLNKSIVSLKNKLVFAKAS